MYIGCNGGINFVLPTDETKIWVSTLSGVGITFPFGYVQFPSDRFSYFTDFFFFLHTHCLWWHFLCLDVYSFWYSLYQKRIRNNKPKGFERAGKALLLGGQHNSASPELPRKKLHKIFNIPMEIISEKRWLGLWYYHDSCSPKIHHPLQSSALSKTHHLIPFVLILSFIFQAYLELHHPLNVLRTEGNVKTCLFLNKMLTLLQSLASFYLASSTRARPPSFSWAFAEKCII